MASRRQEPNRTGSTTFGQYSDQSSTCASVPVRQPARIKLSSNEHEMNVNISKITGSVTVGNRNNVTHYYPEKRNRSGQLHETTNHRSSGWSDSDSWDSGSSDSDSESQRFFDSHGVQMPSKGYFRKMEEMARKMKQMVPRENYIHTLVVNDRGASSAFDANGKPMKIQKPTVVNIPTNRFVSSRGDSRMPSNQHSNGQRPTNPHQLTRYERQTQKFEQIMKNQQNRIIVEEVVNKISPHFGRDWRRVFRHLDFPDAEIDAIFQECEQVQETVHRLLMKWACKADPADVKTLVEALVRADQTHILQFLLD